METEPVDQPDEISESEDAFALGSLDFSGLSPTDFEEFCFDLVSDSGFANVDWRKETPLAASPSDRGRGRDQAHPPDTPSLVHAPRAIGGASRPGCRAYCQPVPAPDLVGGRRCAGLTAAGELVEKKS